MRLVEIWLREEIADKENRKEKLCEPEAGKLASQSDQVEALKSAGGYAHGRLASDLPVQQ